MNFHQIYIENDGKFVIHDIKVKENDFVLKDQLIILLKDLQTENLIEIKAEFSGKLIKIYKNVDDKVRKGDIIMDFKIEQCDEPWVPSPGLPKYQGTRATPMNDCGEDLLQALTISSKTSKSSSKDSIIQSVPELNLKLAKNLAIEDKQRLLKNRKLVLLVDLDQTLIHTTMAKSSVKIPNGISFQTGPKTSASSTWYHTKMRPGTEDFLKNVSFLFELHIVTFGTRSYADTIAEWLDPEQKYFSERILSRDECLDTHSKTNHLKTLFPCGDEMVCIIDDRGEVWNFVPNLIQVKPYVFFKNTGDINDLSKQKSDSEVQDNVIDEATNDQNDFEKNDSDDFLIHLQRILTEIHKTYYELGMDQVPDIN